MIAGHKAAVERAAEALKAKGAKRALLLPVSAPFHCSLMKPAAEKLKSRLAEVMVSVPRIPVVNNVDVATVSDPEAIRDALVRQAAAPVRWVETMQAMQAAGVSHVADCGPGTVLAGRATRCADGLTGLPMADRPGVDSALAAIKGN